MTATIPPSVQGTIRAPLPVFSNLQPPFQSLRPYIPNMEDFCIADIAVRYNVIRKFTEHTDKVLKMLLQPGQEDFAGCTYTNGRFAIFSKTSIYDWVPLATGGWVDWFTCYYGTDIISLYAHQMQVSYHKALHTLWDAFSNKEYFGNQGKKIKWHLQEKHTIALDESRWNILFDAFCTYFYPQPSPYFYAYNNFYPQPVFHDYNNRHGRRIGKVANFHLLDASEAQIFYTLWRQYRGEEEKIISLFPEKPYMIYNEHLISEDIKTVFFESDEKLADDYRSGNPNQHDLLPSTCPGGLKNLLDADFSFLNGKTILVRAVEGLTDLPYLDALTGKCDEINSSLYILFPDDLTPVLSTSILSEPGNFGFQAPAIDVESKKISGFADVGEELPGANREAQVLVKPIIESGSITWLFAAEKVGKTLLGLSIAYAAAKGHRPIGAWHVEEPCRVLYIDGEMPGNKLTMTIDKIMRGFNDKSGAKGRPFALYSFFENDLDYDNILNEDWQKEWNPKIANYNLVILDNYYSLNENRTAIQPFIRWLKFHSRQGVAFLVLDHTNTDGGLQGSLIKKRAADLGIRLESVKQNTVNVTYEFDRYGINSRSSPHTLIPCFASSEFHFEPSSETAKDPEPKKLNEKLLLYAYLLTWQDKGKSNAEISLYSGMSRATVDNYLNAFQPESKLSDPQKKSRLQLTSVDIELVHEEKERLIQLSDNELDQKFKDFKSSTSLSVLQKKDNKSKNAKAKVER